MPDVVGALRRPILARRRRQALWLLGLIALLALAGVGAQVDPGALWQGRGALWGFMAGLWPPVVSTEFLTFLARPLLETIALSLVGTCLAVAMGFPLALLATGTIGDGRLEETRSPLERRVARVLYVAARGLLNVMRAVPDLVWALIFVVLVGLGAVPGVLAIGVAYAGMLGKIYAEILEGMDARPLEALTATGAGRLAVFLYGAVPQAWPQLVSYTLYAWECSMRAAAIMGFVGAGGLGYQLDLSMRMFEFGEVGTLLVALLALVGLVDAVGALVRRTLLSASPLPARLRRAGRFTAAAAAAGMLAAAAVFLAEPITQMLSAEGLGRLGRLAAGVWPPAHEPAFLAASGQAVLETLAIAVLGTAIGAAIGVTLAAFATYNHAVRPPMVAGSGGAIARWAYHGSRWTLNALRAVPEIFFALVFVLAVGLGPFAGALALGLHTGGILGKLYADTLESVDDRALGALVAAGAGPWSAALYSTLPASFSILASHTLFRWEMNIRAAAVLGLVGGGGLGQALYNAVQLGFYDQLLTLVFLLWALVTGVDAVSARLRARRGAA